MQALYFYNSHLAQFGKIGLKLITRVGKLGHFNKQNYLSKYSETVQLKSKCTPKTFCVIGLQLLSYHSNSLSASLAKNSKH